MPQNDSITQIKRRLAEIEMLCPHSALIFYDPMPEHESFFEDLCQVYVEASPEERKQIRAVVSDKKGISNNMLAYVYQAAERLGRTQDQHWLLIGLAVSALQGNGVDYRDHLLACAELYVTAEEAGLDPQAAVERVGGMPGNFDTYAVVRSRRRSDSQGGI